MASHTSPNFKSDFDFDFGELPPLSLGTTISPTRLTFREATSSRSSFQGPEFGSHETSEPQSDDDGSVHAQRMEALPSGLPVKTLLSPVNEHPPRIERREDEQDGHAEDEEDDDDVEDEDLRLALERSRQSAKEEEERRRHEEEQYLQTVRGAATGTRIQAPQVAVTVGNARVPSTSGETAKESKERRQQSSEQYKRPARGRVIHVDTKPPDAAPPTDQGRGGSSPPAYQFVGPVYLQTLLPGPQRNPSVVSPLSGASQRSHASVAVSDISDADKRLSRNPPSPCQPPSASLSHSPPKENAIPSSPPTLVVPDFGRERRPSQSSGRLNIRDASRSRSNSAATASPGGGGSGDLCDACSLTGPNRSYCDACKCTYCDPCWDKETPHKRLLAGTLHEKTNCTVAKKVQDVLRPNLNDDAREQLHIEDIDTTWFGVVREDNELPLFRDYGRYANLIAGTKELRLDVTATSSAYSEHSETLYPSLVSFVGQTGAGKSTLIKLLIDLKSEPEEKFPTPVVGAVAKDVPTSEDVHLYLDPDSSMAADSQAPLLFADCEGLEGGERDPIGAILKKRRERHSRMDPAPGVGNRKQQLKHTSERELTWADTPKKRSREFAVTHLYPRLLYTFSDVIVFVLKNPRVIEGVLERLVVWAQAALEKSSNQPVLPHAIIALNACDNSTPEELWDVETATAELLQSLSRSVFHNDTFKQYAQFWRERDRQIESVEQLVCSYYSSIRVVRIPTIGRPNLIQKQVEKLSDNIRWGSKTARERKADLRMLLDADEFQPYLQVAFDHFAQNLDIPFDFVQASFTNSPIPNDFGGNILKLALQVMECWQDLARGETIFEELSYVVASCIMLDAARNKIRGKPDALFPMYLEHLDNALENFCDRHWPCEFESRSGRCVNVRSGHGAKGHQLKSGKLLAAGDYESNFSFASYRQTFQENTYHKLVALNERVRSRAKEGIAEDQAAADIHKELVLPVFFEHASRGDAQAFVSHTVCFCCLFEPPEHALPCGHIICTPCLKTYGQLRLGKYAEIPECPMERTRFRNAWKIYLKPAGCGIRILTLDGGGVRGIVELEILREIEKELGGGIGIQNLFDLIVGTSTGGIIALGLTARNWTLDQCITNFQALCKKAFTARALTSLPGVGWLVENYHHSKYETQPLHEALTEAFGEDQYLFGGRRSDPGSMDVKVAVTATSAAGTPVVLANYNRLCLDKLPYHFQRPEKLHGELKTWEAARATSAAPKHFKPFCHEPSKQVYTDGGLYNNNPIHIADNERKLIWPGDQETEPDIVVSIGTLFCDVPKDKRSKRWPYARRGIVAHGLHVFQMGLDHIHFSLDSENTWREYLRVKAPGKEHRGRYIRVNPEVQQQPPKLDEVEQMRHLQEVTRHAIGASPLIKTLAQRLVAACFYLDTYGDVKEDYNVERYEVTGYIHCRFLPGFEIAALGKFIQRNAVAGHDPHFIVKEEGNDDEQPQEVRLDKRILTRMINDQVFRMDRVDIRRPTRFARTEISLCLTRDVSYPISGFPRRLHADRPAVTAHRHVITSTNSFRWAGRTNSQQQRRLDWKAPTALLPPKDGDMIERYSDSNHLLGDGTADQVAMYPHTQATQTQTVHELPVAQRSYVELPTVETRADRYFIARDDFHARQSNGLSLRKGDLVKITRMTDEGWWLGQLSYDPRQGWMPSSWLQPAGPGAHARFDRNELDGSSGPVELEALQSRPSEDSSTSRSPRD